MVRKLPIIAISDEISLFEDEMGLENFPKSLQKFSILDFRNYLPLNKKNKIDTLFEFIYCQISFVHFNLKIALWSIWVTTIFENADGSREKLFGKRRHKFFSLLCEHGLWSWWASIFFWMLNHLWRRIGMQFENSSVKSWLQHRRPL